MSKFIGKFVNLDKVKAATLKEVSNVIKSLETNSAARHNAISARDIKKLPMWSLFLLSKSSMKSFTLRVSYWLGKFLK